MPYKKKLKTLKRRRYARVKRAGPSLARQLLRLNETKCYSDFQSTGNMKHDDEFLLAPLQNIVQGSSNTTRVGDNIYLQKIEIAGFFTSPVVAKARSRYRFIAFWSNQQQSADVFTAGGLISTTQLFQPGTYTATPNLGIINPNAVTILADMVVDINCNVDTAAEIKSFQCVIPMNQTYKYDGPSTVYGKTKNLYIYVTPFVGGGTVGVTDAGHLDMSYTVKFKDP